MTGPLAFLLPIFMEDSGIPDRKTLANWTTHTLGICQPVSQNPYIFGELAKSLASLLWS